MRNIKSIFNIFLIIMILACACNIKARRSEVPSDKRSAHEHRFDPLGFEGDNEVITGRRNRAEIIVPDIDTVSNYQNQVSGSIDNNDSIGGEYSAQPIIVFRVQVFASKSFEEAQEFSINIEPLFPASVFVEYQAPYYKVRVGEFYDPDEGEEFLLDVKDMGFKNAWLVRVIQ